jgi:hypothetical protein
MKALARDVNQRYPTAIALADELEKAALAALAMGSVRDVASCLESVVGSDLTKQRDEVRAWLSRSEPSNPTRGPHGTIPPPPTSSQHSNPRYVDSTKTRVEGATKEVDRSALTAPDKVSSVSSAVLQVSTDPTAPSEAATARPRSRGKWYVAIVAAAVIAGGIGFGASRIAGKLTPAAPPPPAATPAVTAAPSPVPSPTHSAESPAPAATEESKPVASVSAAPSASASAPTKKVVRPVVVRPNPATTGATAPDDLSRNPYR